MTGPKIPTGLKRWIRAQQVAYGAALLTLTDHPSIRQQKRVFALLTNLTLGGREAKLGFVDEAESWRYLARCRTLPINVLGALVDLGSKAGAWAAHAPLWKEALSRQRAGKTYSPLAASRLLADRIVGGDLSAAQIIRLARAELREDWSDVPHAERRLTGLTHVLRDLGVPPSDKASSISKLGFSTDKAHWTLVENALFQLVHSWPLLVVPITPAATVDVSLPVGLHVDFDGHGTVRPAFGHSRRGLYFDVEAWLDSFQRAKNGARDLWLSQYGTIPNSAAEQVKGASIIIDTRIAEGIVRRFADWTTRYSHLTFPVVGRSAEALFALAILQRFIGSSAMQTTLATGWLGRFRQDGPGGDYTIEVPEYLDAKIRAAARSHIHNRIIVPTVTGTEDAAPALSVYNADRLSGAARAAFGQAFRRHRYIRCPDLAAAFRPVGSKSRDPYEVRRVLALLAGNRGEKASPIVNFGDAVRPEMVMRALFRLNDDIRELRKRGIHADFGRFAVVRCVPDERNERLWQVVWDQIGGSGSGFFDFQFRVDSYTAGRVLAAELDAAPDLERAVYPRPDVLVLVGYEQLVEGAPYGPLNPFARLGLPAVLKQLARNVLPSRNPIIQEKVGSTRVILVQEPKGSSRWLATPENADSETLEQLRNLAVFRFGFTEQMAADVLNLDQAACRRILKNLTNPVLPGHRYIGYADRPDEYFLLAEPVPAEAAPQRRAALHYRAANAIVGFLAPGPSKANFTEALRPDQVHEAQWHLGQTIRLANHLQQSGYSAISIRWAGRAQDALERLSAVAEPFGWSRMRWALKYSNSDREELIWSLQSHLSERYSRRFFHAHPYELVLASRISIKTSTQLREKKDFQRRIRRQGLTWKRLLVRAEIACARLRMSEAERQSALAEITLWRALMRIAEGTAASTSSSTRADANFLRTQLLRGLPFASEEMFEGVGDLHDDASCREAAKIYELGLAGAILGTTGRFKARLVIKCLGASTICGRYAPSWIVSEIRANAERFSTMSASQRNGPIRLRHLDNRWETGTKIFFGIVNAAIRRRRPDAYAS